MSYTTGWVRGFTGNYAKKVNSDHMNKWYMHNPESVPENVTHKLLWNFEIQTDNLISVRRPDLVIINKKKKKKKKRKEKKRELAELWILLSREEGYVSGHR